MTRIAWNLQQLPTGADLRTAGNDGARHAVLFASGGAQAHRPGTWSSNYEWLLPRILGDLPDTRLGWLRWSDRSWSAVASCTRDIEAALDALVAQGTTSVTMAGFSMGAGAALPSARRAEVTGLLGLAPWFPGADFSPLRGKRLRVLHGTRDGSYAVLPGVPARHSRAAVKQATAQGVDATWIPIRNGIHGWALRAGPRLVRLPRADAWRRAIVDELGNLMPAST